MSHVLRSLSRSRGFVAWTVGSLASGMAVAIAALAFLNASLLRPFPVIQSGYHDILGLDSMAFAIAASLFLRGHADGECAACHASSASRSDREPEGRLRSHPMRLATKLILSLLLGLVAVVPEQEVGWMANGRDVQGTRYLPASRSLATTSDASRWHGPTAPAKRTRDSRRKSRQRSRPRHSSSTARCTSARRSGA